MDFLELERHHVRVVAGTTTTSSRLAALSDRPSWGGAINNRRFEDRRGAQ